MRKKHLVMISGIIALSIASASIMACSSNENESAPEITESPAIIETQAPDATAEVTESVMPEATDEAEEPEVTVEPTAEPTEEPAKSEAATTSAPVEELATQTPGIDYSSYSDKDLIDVVIGQIETKKISSMSEEQLVVYSVGVFRNQIGSGMYSYLTGSNNETVQYIGESLAAIGASSSEELVDDFLGMTRLDLTNTKELSKLTSDEYSYEIFDDEYSVIAKKEVLTTLLADYIRSNMTALGL